MSFTAMMTLNMGGASLAIALIAMSPSLDGRLAFRVPEGRNAVEIIVAADARLVAVSADGHTAIAWSNKSGLRRRLWATGAYITFNPALASGCKA